MKPAFVLALLGCTAVPALSLHAAAPASVATGSIHGRVHNSATGDFLNKARVTVTNRDVSVLTNEFGEYQIQAVPAGEARLTVFYSGLAEENAIVNVTAGQRVVRDFELGGRAATDVVRLEAFSVTASRDMSEAAIATNEQRFALNMKTVVSADTFGDQSEGNVAEFLKFMPSIAVNYVEQDARSVNMRGMPADTTIVTSNGMELASSPTTANRTFEFEKVSINDIAQIEFNKTLLPDMPAEGIGGTINLVTKSAFQRSRPQFNYRGYLNFNTTRLELKKTPGATKEPSWKILPGFDFTYIRPVTKNFGFTVSGAFSQKFNPQYLSTTTWNLNADRTTGVENPYLASYGMQDTPKFTDRTSGRVAFDWRFAPHDVISIGFSEQYYDALWTGKRWNGNAGSNPEAYSAEFTQGRPGAGSIIFSSNASRKNGTTWTPEFKYTHNGPVWQAEVRGSYSHASTHMRSMKDGAFGIGDFSLGTFSPTGAVVNPTVRFDNRGNYLPDVTATLNGTRVDAQDVNNFYLSGRVGENYREAYDVKKNVYYNLRRHFRPGFPLTVKLGGDIRQKIRDLRSYNPSFNMVGADGKPRTRDDAVSAIGYDLVDSYSDIDPPFGLPKFRWPSLYKLHDFFQSHRDWFTQDDAALLREQVTNSKFVRETVSSGFMRLDAAFLQNRLMIVGGVRHQYYRVYSESGQVDNLGQYIHDAEGNIVTDPITGEALRVIGTAYEITALTNVERAVKTRSETPGWYPSFNAVYRVTDNIQLRAGYANSISYPNLSDVAGTTTVSDLAATTRRLTANSPLEPWLGKNYDIDIEYYTPGGGAITVAWFRKDISKFVNQIRHEAGSDAAKEALQRYGYRALIPLDFEVVEKYNSGDARFSGWELGFHQTLDPFVPDWAHGVHVFCNTSYKAAPKGVNASNVNAYSQRTINWGTTIRRGPVTTLLRWNHVPQRKPTRAYSPTTSRPKSRTYLDVDVSYRLTPSMTLFANAANILSDATESYYYSDNTPDYARRRSYNHFGVQCTLGLKGQF